MVQQARNLLMDLEDAGTRVKFVLHDRYASLTAVFDEVFRANGARITLSLPKTSSIQLMPHVSAVLSGQIQVGTDNLIGCPAPGGQAGRFQRRGVTWYRRTQYDHDARVHH